MVARVSVGCLWLAMAACTPSPQNTEHLLRGSTMGTTYTVKVVASASAPLAPERLEELEAGIERELEAVDSRMSTYRTDSELSRFNRWPSTEPFPMSAETLLVMETALEVSRRSGGAFDVTVAPLVDAWGFGPPGEALNAPSEQRLNELLRYVGYEKLQVDPVAGTLGKSDPEVHCDLSAIAKGYAVDRVAEFLAQAGIMHFMVEVGGEVRARGTNPSGEAWRIGIERPVEQERALQRIIPLADRALATSGNYRNFYDLEGQRVSHTIDPHTGRPVEHAAASVSVVHESCLLADAYATALMVLGPDAGYELAARDGLAVLFLVYDGQGGFAETSSPAFNAMLREP